MFRETMLDRHRIPSPFSDGHLRLALRRTAASASQRAPSSCRCRRSARAASHHGPRRGPRRCLRRTPLRSPTARPPRSKQASSLPAATSPVPPSAQPIARPKPMPGPVFELKFHSVPFCPNGVARSAASRLLPRETAPSPPLRQVSHLRRLQCPPAPPTLRALYTMLRLPAPRSPGPGSVSCLPAMESFPCFLLL